MAEWEFVANANCGTGKGGFKQGNTCAASRGKRSLPSPKRRGVPQNQHQALLMAPLDDPVAQHALADHLEEQGLDDQAELLRSVPHNSLDYVATRVTVGLDGLVHVKPMQMADNRSPWYDLTFATPQEANAARKQIHDRMLAFGYSLYRSNDLGTWGHHTVMDSYHLDTGQAMRSVNLQTLNRAREGGPRIMSISVSDYPYSIYTDEERRQPKQPRRLARGNLL